MNAEVVHEDDSLTSTKSPAEVVDVAFELLNVDRAVKTLVVEDSMFKGDRRNDSSCLDADALEVHLDVHVPIAELTSVDRANSEHDFIQVDDKRLLEQLSL